MYTFKVLDHTTAAEYETMTFSCFRDRLKTLGNSPSLIAIGVSCLKQQVGLLLAELQLDNKVAEVLSIYVKPNFRNIGIGTALLAQLEEILQKQSCTEIKIIYMAGKPSTPILERVLQKCHWNPPSYRMAVCKSLPENMVVAPWLYRYRLSTGYSVFPWVELTWDERKSIQLQQQQEPWYPEELTPFYEEDTIEPITSLGLRYKGEIAGWVITHRIAPDAVRYTKLFVRKDIQAMGRAISLLGESFKRHYANFSSSTCGICTVALDNPLMLKFVQRHLAPYLTEFTDSKGCTKSLSHYMGINSNESN